MDPMDGEPPLRRLAEEGLGGDAAYDAITSELLLDDRLERGGDARRPRAQVALA